MTGRTYNEIVSELTTMVEKDPVKRMLIFTLFTQEMTPEQLNTAARIAVRLLETYSDDRWAAEWMRSIEKDPHNLIMFLKIRAL